MINKYTFHLPVDISFVWLQTLLLIIILNSPIVLISQVDTPDSNATISSVKVSYHLDIPGYGIDPVLGLPFVSEKRNNVFAFSNFYANSNAMSHSMVNRLVFGGFVDSDIKGKSMKKLNPKNKTGFDFTNGVGFQHIIVDKQNKKSGSWFVRYNHFIHTDITYSEDFYNLVFFGNAMFEGQSAVFDGLKSFEQTSSALYFGYSKFLIKDNQKGWALGASAGIHLASNLIETNAATGRLFTAMDGEYLELDIDAESYLSDTGRFSLFANNGTGFTGSLKVTHFNNNTTFDFSVSDIGIMSWNKNTLHINMDTLVRYEGTNVGDIIGDGSGEGIDLDTLLDITNAKTVKKNYIRSYPATFRFSIMKIFGGGASKIRAGAEYRLNAYPVPLIYVKYYRQFFNAELGIEGIASYGGYGGFNLGVGLNKQLGKFKFVVGSNHILSYFSPKTITGNSFYANIGFDF